MTDGMTPQKVVGVFLLGAALAVAAGLLFDAADDSPEGVRSPVSGAMDRFRADDTTQDEAIVGAQATESAAAVAPSSEREAVASSVRPPPILDTPTARPTLPSEPVCVEGLETSGVVVDSAGRGVPGVKIWFERYCDDPAVSEKALLEMWKDSRGEAIGEQERRVMLLPHLAESDASGGFVLPPFPPGRVLVKAVGSGLQIDPESEAVATVGSSIRLRASRKVDVLVSVKDSEGRALGMATLRLSRNRIVSEQRWFEREPTVSLVEGRFEISAYVDGSGGDAGLESKPRVVDVREGMEPIEIVLGDQGSIRVTLLGFDAPEAFCLAADAIPPGVSAVEFRAVLRDRALRGTSFGLGVSADYRFQTLEPGRYEIFVFPCFRAPYFLRKSCEVTSTREELTFRYEELHPSPGFHCRIEGALSVKGMIVGNARPCEFRVRAHFGSESIDVPIEVVYHLEKPEAWLFPGVSDWAALRPGRLPDSFTVWALSKESGSGEAVVAMGQQDVSISLSRSQLSKKTLSVFIRNAGELPTGEFSLLLTPISMGKDPKAMRRPDYVPLPSVAVPTPVELEVGTYQVDLLFRGGEGGEPVLYSSQTVDLETTTHVEFDAPQLCSLDLSFTGSTKEVTVILTPLDRDRFGQRTESCPAGERRRIDGILAGVWRVEAQSLGSLGEFLIGTAIVAVPAQTTRQIDLEQPNRIQVEVTHPEGFLATAGFQNGDRIVAVDGVRITGESHPSVKQFSRSATDEAVRLTIDRAGAEIVIEWKPPTRLERRFMGGSMVINRSP